MSKGNLNTKNAKKKIGIFNKNTKNNLCLIMEGDLIKSTVPIVETAKKVVIIAIIIIPCIIIELASYLLNYYFPEQLKNHNYTVSLQIAY